MRYHAEKTELGWEIADETNTFEANGPVFSTKREAIQEAREWERPWNGVSHAEMVRPE